MSFAFIECVSVLSCFRPSLGFSTREKISGRSLVFISTHTYCSDAGRLLLKFARILSHGFDLETVARLCRVASSWHARGPDLSLVRLTEGHKRGEEVELVLTFYTFWSQENGCSVRCPQRRNSNSFHSALKTAHATSSCTHCRTSGARGVDYVLT